MKALKLVLAKIQAMNSLEDKEDAVYDFMIQVRNVINGDEINAKHSVSKVMIGMIEEDLKPKKRTVAKKREAPEYEEFKQYAFEKSNKVDEVLLRRKYESWKVNDWRNGHNKPILNWKTTLLNTLQYLESEENTKQAYDRNSAIQRAKTLFS